MIRRYYTIHDMVFPPRGDYRRLVKRLLGLQLYTLLLSVSITTLVLSLGLDCRVRVEHWVYVFIDNLVQSHRLQSSLYLCCRGTFKSPLPSLQCFG